MLGAKVAAAGSGMGGLELLFNPVLRKSCTSRSTDNSGKEDNIMQLDMSYNSMKNLDQGPLRLHRWSLSPSC